MREKIKYFIERILYLFFSTKNTEKIYKLIEDYEYVSFDIFDTLIKRNVKYPSDIFDLIKKQYNMPNNEIDFKKIRKNAYKMAKENSNDEEINIDEIYKYINNFDYNEKENIKNIEKKIEIANSKKNEFVSRIYKYCIQNNKRIFITSDMYLDQDTIEKILQKNGYNTYYKLYLSSCEKTTKKTGGLYKKMLTENNLKKNEVIHIGDSFYNDYIMSKKNGINAILIRK